jgi:long-chain acyl-CoA synthetase
LAARLTNQQSPGLTGESPSLETIGVEDENVLECAASDILERLPARLSHGILAWVEKTPDAPALNSNGRQLSYRQLGAAIDEAKALLLERGVRAGDRVMLVAENGIALACLFIALSELDGIGAVINARMSDREIDLIAADCDPRLVICTAGDSADARAHGRRLGAEPVSSNFGEFSWTKALASEAERVSPDPAQQVLAMIYTTGTTGAPKGVMLTHRNLSFIAFISGRLRGVRPGDRVYCVLPMSHVFGLSAVCCSVLFSGGCVHLVGRFSAAATLQAMQEDSIVGFLGVPTMYALMLEQLEQRARNNQPWQAACLRFMFSGGAPLDPDLKSRVENSFGMPLHNGYGLTETGPTICQTRLYAPLANCSVGYPLPCVEVKLLDKDGQIVAPGEIGELWVKGPNVMKGYFRKPELTAEVVKDGWFNTADLVFQDVTGAMNIAGRTKELIIRSGFNVYPPEVEAVLASHPSVSLCAVMGRKIAGDEEIIAFVQPVEGVDIDPDALLHFSRAFLAGYKLPSRIIIRQQLPTAPSGKILKHQLTEDVLRLT